MTQLFSTPRTREERPGSSRESPNIHPREMDTSWHTIQWNSASTLSSSTMENDNTGVYHDFAVLSTEPEQAWQELAEAQDSANTHPDTCLGRHTNHVLRQGSTSPEGHSTHDDAQPEYLCSRTKNVILFGETGAGKSSVINLLAGKEVAKTSSSLQGCTLEATEYPFSLSEDMSIRIFDTVGLEEPEIGVNSFMGAIDKAHKLVQSLHSSGGIDLLLFCIRGGRITAAMQRSYRMFYEILCGSQVPLAVVVTNLELEDVMEDWWVRNENTFAEYGIRSVAHVCITAVPAHITVYAQKREESQETLRNMLLDTLTNPRPPYVRDIRSWFAAIIYLLRSLVTNKESLKKKDLTKKLERRCRLPRDDAEELALMLVRGETD